MTGTHTDNRLVNASNRFGLDYAAEAVRLGPPARPIIDVHAHVSGDAAARLMRRTMDLYGVERVYSMSPLEQVEPLRAIFGSRIRFIAVPNYWATDNRAWHMGEGYVERVRDYHRLGARIVKFWSAPRAVDFAKETGDPGFMRLDAPHKVRVMTVAAELGMMFMTHIGDPDTWFRTKYADARTYGTKTQQYEPLEQALRAFPQPWIAAHMGGWPENLDFLDGLLDRHDNLHLDTSATKWMVRELSRHSNDRLLAFLRQWKGRILFGSDIVTSDDHLRPVVEEADEMRRKANSEREAFDLYASRYWALRTMFETNYDGESPIADPDLAMNEPDRHTDMDAPRLVGRALPADILRSLYGGGAEALIDTFFNDEADAGTTRANG